MMEVKELCLLVAEEEKSNVVEILSQIHPLRGEIKDIFPDELPDNLPPMREIHDSNLC